MRILANENRTIVVIWVGIVARIHGVLPLLEMLQRRIRVLIYRQIQLQYIYQSIRSATA